MSATPTGSSTSNSTSPRSEAPKRKSRDAVEDMARCLADAQKTLREIHDAAEDVTQHLADARKRVKVAGEKRPRGREWKDPPGARSSDLYFSRSPANIELLFGTFLQLYDIASESGKPMPDKETLRTAFLQVANLARAAGPNHLNFFIEDCVPSGPALNSAPSGGLEENPGPWRSYVQAMYDARTNDELRASTELYVAEQVAMLK